METIAKRCWGFAAIASFYFFLGFCVAPEQTADVFHETKGVYDGVVVFQNRYMGWIPPSTRPAPAPRASHRSRQPESATVEESLGYGIWRQHVVLDQQNIDPMDTRTWHYEKLGVPLWYLQSLTGFWPALAALIALLHARRRSRSRVGAFPAGTTPPDVWAAKLDYFRPGETAFAEGMWRRRRTMLLFGTMLLIPDGMCVMSRLVEEGSYWPAVWVACAVTAGMVALKAWLSVDFCRGANDGRLRLLAALAAALFALQGAGAVDLMFLERTHHFLLPNSAHIVIWLLSPFAPVLFWLALDAAPPQSPFRALSRSLANLAGGLLLANGIVLSLGMDPDPVVHRVLLFGPALLLMALGASTLVDVCHRDWRQPFGALPST